MQSAFSIPSDALPAYLGVPGQRSLSELAALLGVDRIRLSPSRLRLGGPLVLALRYTVARLRGEPVAPLDVGVWARAGALLERLDEGDTIDVIQLGQRLILWGMPTSLDWVARLHAAGAEEVFARGGWCAVRAWARGIVMEGR
jgi:hypothetical protein